MSKNEDLEEYDKEFVEKFSNEELVEMIYTTNYLNIPAIFELCCAAMAARMKGQNFEALKNKDQYKGITKSFSEEDDERLKEAYPFVTEYAEDLRYENMEGNTVNQ